MSPFQYRALDLLADYETRFAYFPSMWFNQIKDCANNEVQVRFAELVDAMCRDASYDLGDHLEDNEMARRLAELTEREMTAIKLMGDLGVRDMLTTSVFSYFVTRQRLIEDERGYVRFTKLIDEEIDMRAC